MTSDRLLRQAALEAESDPATIGHALARYRAARGWSRARLAEWLGVTPTGLAALAIQPRPDPAAPTFADLVAGLADRYGVDPWRLADALG